MPASITVSELVALLAGPNPPTILDVRREQAFEEDPRMLPGAVRVPPEGVLSWADQLGSSPVEAVVYCVHGHQVSQGAAQALEGRVTAVRYLRGGIEQWRAEGGSTVAASTDGRQGDRLKIGEGSSMKDASSEVTTETLEAFADAWNRHDANALMSFMTADCVFESSAGPDVCGTRYEGAEAVRAGYVRVWTTFADAHWGNARHFVCGDRGVSEWTFTGTGLDGTRVEVHGCDLFTFQDGRIAVKDSYRKNRPPPANARS